MTGLTVRSRIALVLAAAVVGTGVAADDTVVVRRTVALEDISGRVERRLAYGARVDVPATCDDGRMACRETRRFEQIVDLAMVFERRGTAGGEVVAEHDPVGHLRIAVSLDDDAFERLLASIDRRVRALSADAFRAPLAGLDPGEAPFDAVTLARTGAAAWTCVDTVGSRTAWHHVRTGSIDDGDAGFAVGSTGYTDPDLADPLCAALGDATRGVYPDEFRTLTAPTLLEIEEIRVRDVVDLPPEAWRDQLAAWPDGAWRTRSSAPGAVSGSWSETDDDSGSARASITRTEVREVARILPAELPVRLLDGPSWLQRWSVTRVARPSGSLPRDAPIDQYDVLVAWLPTAPPAKPGEDPSGPPDAAAPRDDGPFRIEADPERLARAVAERLGREGHPLPPTLVDAVLDARDGLRSDGWLAVACLPDGTAVWGLPPIPARADVVDPGALCAEISGRVPVD